MSTVLSIVKATITPAQEAAFNPWYDKDADHLRELVAEYNARFGTVSERDRSAYVQVWP